MDQEDWKVYSFLQEMWEPKYGKPLDLRGGEAKSELSSRLHVELRRSLPVAGPPGSLVHLINKKRPLLERHELPMPDLNRIITACATRPEAIDWLAMLERERDHRLISRGIDVPFRDLDVETAVEKRVADFLLSCGEEWWPEVTVQLRPLLDYRFRSWLESLRGEGAADSQQRSMATKLLKFLEG